MAVALEQSDELPADQPRRPDDDPQGHGRHPLGVMPRFCACLGRGVLPLELAASCLM